MAKHMIRAVFGATLALLGASAMAFPAEGAQEALREKTHCIVAKQVRADTNAVLASTRVCAPIFRTVELFPDRMLGERPYSDRFGPSALVSAKISFFSIRSRYLDGDSSEAHIWLTETGPAKQSHQISVTRAIENCKPAIIHTAGGVDIILSADPDNRPNTFEQRLVGKMGAPEIESAKNNACNKNTRAWRARDHAEREIHLMDRSDAAPAPAPIQRDRG